MALNISRGRVARAQKVVVYGPEGIGKTTLAAQFPDPLFIDTEGGSNHMDVARTERPGSWAALEAQVAEVAATRPCGTVVLDTADWAESLCVRSICAERKLSGIEDMGYGKGYTYLAEKYAKLLDALTDCAEAGVNVVLVCHAQMRKFEQPDEAAPYDRWELKLQKKVAPLVKEWADAILFANYKVVVETVDGGMGQAKGKARGGKRVVFSEHHPCWDAKNRWGLPPEFDLGYGPIAPHVPLMAGPAAAGAPAAPEAQAPAADASPAPSGDGGLPAFWGPALQLVQGVGADLDGVRRVAVARGFFTEDTPLSVYPREFVEGCIVAQWPAWEKALADLEPVPF